MSIYFVEGKRLDTEKLVWLYGDGRMRGGRPVYYWMTKNKKRFFVESQTQWQGEHPEIVEVSREEMIEILTSAVHPERAEKGLEIIGASGEIETIE